MLQNNRRRKGGNGMQLKEINAINFRIYGAPAESAAGYEDAQQTLHDEDIRISSALWSYDEDVLVEPVTGVGVMFVRAEDGIIQKFLFDRMATIRAGVAFCILPYECRRAYRLYSRTERKVVPVTTVLSGTGFVPGLSIHTLYTVLYQEKEQHFTYHGDEYPFWEFLYVQKGQMEVEADGKAFELKQGQMIFFPPHKLHKQKSEGPNPLTFLSVTFDGEISHSDIIGSHPVYADDDCQKIIQSILKEDKEGDICADDMIVCELTRLMITVLRNIHADSIVTRIPPRLRVTVDNSYITECINLIHQNITGSITLPWLAKQLSLSPSYLSSLFKQKVGRSISEYVRLVRLEKVKDMIAEGRYTIAQISDVLGYCSPTYLSTEFKREFGISPKEYAKMIG